MLFSDVVVKQISFSIICSCSFFVYVSTLLFDINIEDQMV